MGRRLLPIVFLLVGPPLLAGEFNKVLSIGDPAPKWVDLPGTDGKKHSLADLKDKEVVVVVFTCNSCPIAEDYEDRLIAFARSHAKAEGKVGLVAINVNTAKDDRLDEMTKRAEKKKFSFPYLYDESQKIARQFGARFTPEFFVFDKNRKLVYQGAMDDTSTEKNVKDQYVVAAVDAALKGEAPAKKETLPRGCQIRFKRDRD